MVTAAFRVAAGETDLAKAYAAFLMALWMAFNRTNKLSVKKVCIYVVFTRIQLTKLHAVPDSCDQPTATDLVEYRESPLQHRLQALRAVQTIAGGDARGTSR